MSAGVRAGWARPLIQTFAFVRKETLSTLRQPRLLLVLVAGPFLILLLFAAGYDQQHSVIRTEFVGPADSIYEETTAEFADELDRYLEYRGYGTDLIAAERRLAAGELDVVVVFPADPVETVLNDEQAVITVLHDKLDPIQVTAVEVSAEVAVRELNTMILQEVVTAAQDEARDADRGEGELGPLAVELQTLAAEEADDPEQIERWTERALEIQPRVLVRPFVPDTENLLRESTAPADFFAPAAIALLVQHMALTFAAMGLVKDRGLGLFELFRVAPVGPVSILGGKSLAYLLLCGGVGGALLVAVVQLVGVPYRGDPVWGAVGLVALVAASIAWGTVVSLLARSDTQAVQYSMLVLLAGLFFGGFLLALEAIRFPVRLVSFLLPVTYATRIFRDVMLRGTTPDPMDLVGLVVLTVVMGIAAWVLLARRLRLG